MGMAASQARLLELTSRQNAISRRLTELATRKMSLTRETRLISRQYNDALNSKIYKWSNGSTYQTLNYNTLMKPNSVTNNKNYLITDLNGRVVLDGNYAKYAEMFSPNGQPGAEWGGDTRFEILSKLTGIDINKLKQQNSMLQECYDKKDTYTNAQNSKPVPESYNQQQSDLRSLIETSNKNSNITIPIGADTISSFDSLNLSQISNYLGSDKNKEAWSNAVNEIAVQYRSNMANKKEIKTELFEGNNGQYKVNWDKLLEALTAQYKANGGEVVTSSSNAYNTSGNQILWFNPQDYANYKAALDKWNNEVYQPAANELEQINSDYDALFDAETENLIKFYDTMFSAIAENGWVVDYNINDSERLNNMLQNNQYMITTVDRNTEYDESSRDFKYSNEYKTQLASQVNNLVEVNDNDIQTRALAEYEEKKEKINEKEQRIDLEMSNKKTEYDAIKNMIESINNVKNKNIENTFNIFS